MKPALLLASILLKSLSLLAQDTLYTSAENLRQHNYRLVKTKISWNNSITCNALEDSNKRYGSDSLFLLLAKKLTHRFYYKQPVTLFYSDSLICLYSSTNGNGLKNNPIVESYYFSTQLDSPIYKFTLNNLIINYPYATPTLLGFVNASDTDLAQWDSRFQLPRIAYLLQHLH